MPEQETREAYERSGTCDLFIVIGSSLVVQPAAYMPVVAHKSGAKLVIINRDETSCDDIADIVVKAQAGPTMASVLARVREALSKKQ
jgi:NAD-dependent deacetylase